MEAYAGGTDLFNDAFGVFVERHQSALLSFAAAFLRDDSLAQDVVQEAFMRAARNPARILDAGNHGAGEADRAGRNWMLKVVRDLSVDSIRRRASERRTVERMSSIAPASAPPADQHAEAEEENARVRAAIDRLKPRFRELLFLKVRENKSYKEIAQIVGLSATNVGFLLHQAMKELGEALKKSQ